MPIIIIVDQLDAGAVVLRDGRIAVARGATQAETEARISAALAGRRRTSAEINKRLRELAEKGSPPLDT